MENSNWFRRYLDRIREKHKLTFINDTDYKEKWSFRLSILNMWSLFALYTILIIVGLFFAIKFTPLKNLFAEGPVDSVTEKVIHNTNRIDSLIDLTNSRQKYLDDLTRILKDEPFDDSLYMNDSSAMVQYEPNFDKSKEDSLLRYKIEHAEELSEESLDDPVYDIFVTPVKGRISQSFTPKKGHYGIDVVSEKDTYIKSCLQGTVIFSAWTSTGGNVIMVQHSENLISVYEHCSVILKDVGEMVQSGDPIALVGNSGDHSSGYHLHFEVWKNGVPLNPQEFISFE